MKEERGSAARQPETGAFGGLQSAAFSGPPQQKRYARQSRL